MGVKSEGLCSMILTIVSGCVRAVQNCVELRAVAKACMESSGTLKNLSHAIYHGDPQFFDLQYLPVHLIHYNHRKN